MKHKRSKTRTPSTEVQQPSRRTPRAQITSQWLDQVAAGAEKDIRDTPAWQEAVRRLGW